MPYGAYEFCRDDSNLPRVRASIRLTDMSHALAQNMKMYRVSAACPSTTAVAHAAAMKSRMVSQISRLVSNELGRPRRRCTLTASKLIG